MTRDPDDIPLFWSEEGHSAEVVRCHYGHLAFRETFEKVGGCPYCTYTPDERVAALRAVAAERRQQRTSPDATPACGERGTAT